MVTLNFIISGRVDLAAIFAIGGVDFLSVQEDSKCGTIITNPPFNLMQEFVEKVLKIAENKVIMFGKIQFLEGEKRKMLFEEHPFQRMYVFSKRQNPMRDGEPLDENGKKWTGTMCFAWFVWDKDCQQEPTVYWI